MKRFISIAMICFILVISLSPSVSAEESDLDPFINILEYDTADDRDNYFYFSNETTLTYSMPFTGIYTYVDLVFSFSGPSPTSVSAGRSGSMSELTIVAISADHFRAYGKIRNLSYSYLDLNFKTGSSSETYIGIESFRTYRSGYSMYDDICSIWVSPSDLSSSVSMASPGSSLSANFNYSGALDHFDYVSYIYLDNWRKYDFMEYFVAVKSTTINSIVCYFKNASIPCTISYLEGNTPGYDDQHDVWYDPDTGQMVPNDSSAATIRYILIRVDLRELDRSFSGTPYIRFAGQGAKSSNGYFSISSCKGFVDLQTVSTDVFYYREILESISVGFSNVGTWISNQTSALTTQFTQLKTSLSSHFSDLDSWITDQTLSFGNFISNHTALVKSKFATLSSELTAHFSDLNSWIDAQTDTLENAIRGDTSPGDSFQDDVDDKDQQLDDMADVMDSVNKPSLDSVNVNVNQYVSASDLASLTSPLLVLLTGDVFGTIFIMTIILATVSYVLYGKR